MRPSQIEFEIPDLKGSLKRPSSFYPENNNYNQPKKYGHKLIRRMELFVLPLQRNLSRHGSAGPDQI